MWWNEDIQNIPLDKFVLLKCQYMMLSFEIIAKVVSIKNNLYIKEVAPKFKGTELEEMVYRSTILGWREDI